MVEVNILIHKPMIFMKENGLMIKNMVKELIDLEMEIYTVGIGIMIKCMEKVNLLLVMEKYVKENSRIIDLYDIINQISFSNYYLIISLKLIHIAVFGVVYNTLAKDPIIIIIHNNL